MELLAKAPDPVRAAKLTRAQISAVLKRAGRRNIAEKTSTILAALRTPQLGQGPAVTTAYAAIVRSQVAILHTLLAQIATLEGQVEADFGRHPDAEILLSQPGLGQILGPRVLGEFGDAPGRFADAKARKNYAGTAPITRRSGKTITVHARFVHNDRLVDALHQQAGPRRRGTHLLRRTPRPRNRTQRRTTPTRQPSRRHPARLPQNPHRLRPRDRLVTPLPTPRRLTP